MQKKEILTYLLVFFVYGQLNVLALDINYKEKVQEYYKLGQIYYEHGLFKEAEVQFQKALEISEKNLPKIKKKKPKIEDNNKPKLKSSTIQRSREYIIGAGDLLHIAVWENPDLTQEVIVRPDGKISFPLINEVQAAGITISELDNALTKRLKEYVKYPDVSVSLKEIYGEKVIVLGEVRSAGVYKLETRKTVSEAIALAGGYTNDAVLRSVIVIRGGLKNPHAKRVNIARALQKGKFEEDIQVQAQDIIYVPKKFIADVNYYLSQILGPLSQGAVATGNLQTIER